MTTFGIIAPRTSASARRLAEKFKEVGWNHWWQPNQHQLPDVFINYGFKGAREIELYRSFGMARPILNHRPVGNKYETGLLVSEVTNFPESHHTLRGVQDPENFIYKPYYSQRGRNIMPALEARERRGELERIGYYQRLVPNKRYELRVFGAFWETIPNWGIWKKVLRDGEDGQIAWNHDQGGTFQNIINPETGRRRIDRATEAEARRMTKAVLQKIGLHFGAVDFIVDENRKLWFLEVNLRPGFTEFSQNFYFGIFEKLSVISEREIVDKSAEFFRLPQLNHEVLRGNDIRQAQEELVQRNEQAIRDLKERLNGVLQRWGNRWNIRNFEEYVNIFIR